MVQKAKIKIKLVEKGLAFGKEKHCYGKKKPKAGYTATPVACGWAGAIFEVT